MKTIDFEKLTEAARHVALNSYCPYSRYRVGAALLADNGMIYSGCNVENASFGLTVCAERAAVMNAVADGVRGFRALVVAAGTQDRPGMPCGACRQVLSEFCALDMPVLCATLDGSLSIKTTLGDLLPHGFTKHDVEG
ncbi:MAG: cytidine deaminase [Kiritimatiellia bacterium]|jgi:cytidine deaminase